MAPEGRGATTTATLTTSTTSVIVWSVAHWGFHGEIPPEIYGWLMMAVPTGLGLLAAEVARWRARRALQAP